MLRALPYWAFGFFLVCCREYFYHVLLLPSHHPSRGLRPSCWSSQCKTRDGILDCYRVRGAGILKLDKCGERTRSIPKTIEEKLELGGQTWSVPLFLCLLALCLISSGAGRIRCRWGRALLII